MKHLLLALSLALPMLAGANDEDLAEQLAQEFTNYGVGCGTPIPQAAQAYQRYQQLKRIETYALNQKPLPFTIGSSSVAGGGLILFTSAPTNGYVLGGGSSILDIYTTPNLKHSALFYMITSEGPGPLELLLLDQSSANPSMHCITLATPEDLNRGGWKMEFSTPYSFNINELGKGILYTEADIDYADDPGQRQTLWFAYYTQDGGKTWSQPERLMQKPPKVVEGLYQKVPTKKW
ncbi:hypothetical protein [Thiofilum flexile]|uniref:hypothetical protein n=1 Tax=Thiofilum flexile TaxID=125627 RepID=UPI00037E9176|nr:hypothetical protein [Thiofilum flexile]